MLDNPFRAVLPNYTRGLVGLYSRMGLTPNGISWIAFGLGAIAAWCVAQGHVFSAIGLWWLGRLADGTDGIFARETGQASAFGAYLDIVLDMAAYGLMILGFAWLHPELHARWLGIEFLYVLCITSALALGMQEAEAQLEKRDNRGLRLGAGLAEGGETGIAYTLFLLFPSQIGWLSAVWLAVLVTTVVARSLLAREMLKG